MPQTQTDTFSRRRVLAGAAVLPASLAIGAPARAVGAGDDSFTYEITRTEVEWRARLNELEFFVMRQGGTEPQHTSLLAFQKAPGTYACRGCDLTAFDSDWKVQHPDIGWVFFSQARPDTVLTSIDMNFGMMGDDEAEAKATIECHCRRCGSHFGHILDVRGEVLHCLNGTSLVFSPS